jgi:hypothetical protein
MSLRDIAIDWTDPTFAWQLTAKVPKEEAVANSGKGLDLFQRELCHDGIGIIQVVGSLGWGANPILARVGIATAFLNPIAGSRTQTKDGTRHALFQATNKQYNEKGSVKHLSTSAHLAQTSMAF